MHVIVAGCGRVGSGLARSLGADGHVVRVIDHDPRAHELLGSGFRGTFVEGSAIARDVLERAGVAEAEALVAVTSSDTANLVAARTAREAFRVPRVVARAYDPRRADVYAGLGIPTVAHVSWTIAEVRDLLFHQDLLPERTFGNGETVLVRTRLAGYLAGRPLADLNLDGFIQVVEVTRDGRSFVPPTGALVQSGDLVTFVVAGAALDQLRALAREAAG
ncbi:MAG TPA: TrkA family potassium uptake protein [Candidatus Dormibacteraeota bacterium]|nr:TrkA family potassium uptake protein [Candidatus Dormibacteraeota bacterium]